MAAQMTLRQALDRYPPAPTQYTDQDLHNLVHRLRGVKAVRNSEEYRKCTAMAPGERPASPRPTLPYYRLLSKRKWEAIMMKWRTDLGDLCIIRHTADLSLTEMTHG